MNRAVPELAHMPWVVVGGPLKILCRYLKKTFATPTIIVHDLSTVVQLSTTHHKFKLFAHCHWLLFLFVCSITWRNYIMSSCLFLLAVIMPGRVMTSARAI